MTVLVPYVIAFTAQELTMWRVALGMGAVVIAVVILLLSFLVRTVAAIDAGVAGVLAAAGGVAANTGHLEELATTNEAALEIKNEALRHAALVETL